MPNLPNLPKLRNLVPALLALLCGISPAREPAPSRWALDAGLGIRLWDNSALGADQREYLEQARVGPVGGADAAAFPWRRLGLGLTYAQFFAAASEQDMFFLDSSRGSARDTWFIVYTAPAVYWTQPLGDRAALVAQGGVGWFLYRNASSKGSFPGVVDGGAPGFHTAISADYRLSSHIAIGAGLRLLHGTLAEPRYNALEAPLADISLTRLDVLAGVRFYP